jgi:hypothetical protein
LDANDELPDAFAPSSSSTQSLDSSTHQVISTMENDAFVPSLPFSQDSCGSTGTFPGILSSQSTLIGPTTQTGSDVFRGAVRKFRARLSGENLTDFKSTGYDQLVYEIMRIQHEQENNKKMLNFKRIESFLEAMDQFGKVIEVFLNVSDAVAFVWGPIKFLLLVRTSRFSRDPDYTLS